MRKENDNCPLFYSFSVFKYRYFALEFSAHYWSLPTRSYIRTKHRKNVAIMDFRGSRPDINSTELDFNELDFIAAVQDTLLDTYCSACPLDIAILLLTISTVFLSLINIYTSCQKTRLVYKNVDRDTS